jgi:GT2 family glycosyltransferase
MVDNASADKSVEFVNEFYPHVKILVNGVNLGFAAANNQAARYANGDYILLLNNDTVLLGDPAALIDIIRCNKNVGLIGAKMLSKDHKYRQSVGRFPSILSLLWLKKLFRSDGQFLTGDFDDTASDLHAVDWVEGSFHLIPTLVWKQIGGLDEGYFMYVEDVDLCKRVSRSGLIVAFSSRISYVHYGGYTSKRYLDLIRGHRRYQKRNSIYPIYLINNAAITFGLVFKFVLFYVMSKCRVRRVQEKCSDYMHVLLNSPW